MHNNHIAACIAGSRSYVRHSEKSTYDDFLDVLALALTAKLDADEFATLPVDAANDAYGFLLQNHYSE